MLSNIGLHTILKSNGNYLPLNSQIKYNFILENSFKVDNLSLFIEQK